MNELAACLLTIVNVVAALVVLWGLHDASRRDTELRRRESALRFMEKCDSTMLAETRRRAKAGLN